MTRTHRRLDIHWQMLIGIVLGIGVGFWLGSVDLAHVADIFTPLGDIFLKLLKMIIVPLVAASVFLAVAQLGNLQKMGQLGVTTLLYYLATTTLAVILGLVLVNLIEPGVGVELGTASMPDIILNSGVSEQGFWSSILSIFMNIIPTNPFDALSSANVLQIIFFSMFAGILTAMIGEKGEPLVRFMGAVNHLMFKATDVVMLLAPYGVFGLLVGLVAHLGLSPLLNLGSYMITVLLGLTIHGTISLGLILFIFGKRGPATYAKAMMPALSTAFSTSSSAATLPLTIDCAIDRGGVNKETTEFVLPLGATINMDGTALYEAVAAVFIAQAYGIELSLGAQIIIVLTATLASIGAAAIPSAGLVTMAIVLNAVGLPLEGIGLILAVDRVLDMCRTTVNVWGDAVGAAVVSRYDAGLFRKSR